MQLLLILMLFLYGGRGDGGKLLNEFRPVLETFGGDEIKSALKNADELRQVISAFSGTENKNDGEYASTNSSENTSEAQNVGAGFGAKEDRGGTTYSSAGYAEYGSVDNRSEPADNGGQWEDYNKAADQSYDKARASNAEADDFPLAPVAGIADKEILYRLVRFFSEPTRAVH